MKKGPAQRGGIGRVAWAARTAIMVVLMGGIGIGAIGVIAVPGLRGYFVDLVDPIRAIILPEPHQVRAVDVLASSEDADHDGKSVIDNSTATFWTSEGDGVGATLEIVFPEATDLNNILITPGAKGEFARFARPRDIEISAGQGDPVSKTLDDTNDPAQKIDVSFKAITTLRVRIVSVHPSIEEPAVAISELEFFVNR